MSTETIHDGGFNHLLHSVQTATVPGCTTPEAIGVAAENLNAAASTDPCLAEMGRQYEEAKREYKKCFSECHDDDDEPEVEEEVDRRREWDRILKYGMVILFAASGFGLLLPAAPTPIDDSLPSSGVHSPARGSDPGKDAWAGPLWTT